MIVLNPIAAQVEAYLKSVGDGSTTACATVRGACERHQRDLWAISDPEFPYEFRIRLAERACSFFPLVLRHSVGEWSGLPFELSDWQQFVIYSVFGWVQKSDGMRRFRRAYIEVARKNGKSTLVAGIALLTLHLDREDGAQVFVGATKREQASIIHNEAEKMTRASPSLMKLTTIHKGNMSVSSTNSLMRPVSSDRPFDGWNPHAVMLDEMHAFREQHRPFYQTITSGSASRRQPLFVVTTTAGDDKSLIWQEEHEHAAAVATGRVRDDRLFAYVATLDKDDDPFDESTWEKANPNLGISVKLDYLRQQAAEARNKPTYRNAFIRYHCNRRVSCVEQAVTAEQWDVARKTPTDWASADYIGAGFDLGGRDDLAATGYCARFPVAETEDGKTVWRYELKAKSYIFAGAKRNLDQQPWQRWIYEGRLHKCENVIAQLEYDLLLTSEVLGVSSVAFDPHNARQLGDELEAAGLKAVGMPQNCGQYNEPLREFLNALVDGRLTHDGDELLSWCVLNMALFTNRKGEWMPDKKHSKEKIDTAVACLMAFREAYFAAGGNNWYYSSGSVEVG